MNSATTLQLTLSEIISIITAIVVGFGVVIGYVVKFNKKFNDLDEVAEQVAKNSTKLEEHDRHLSDGKSKFSRLDEIVTEREKQVNSITLNCQKHTDKIANIELEHVRMVENSRSTDEKLNQIFRMLDEMNKSIQSMAISIAEFKKSSK